MRNSGLTVSRHVLGALSVITLAFAGIGVLAGTGQAQSPTLTVNPQTGLSDGQSVTVTGTDIGALNFVAVVECGNADSNGTPLPGTAPTPADCYGAESVGSQTILVIADGSGTATTSYNVHDHGIGSGAFLNNRRCINNGNFDCLIAMADIATMGQALLISAPICFGEGCTVGPPPPAIVNPGLAPTTTPTGPEEEAAPPPSGPGAAPPAPAVMARPSLTG
jgi:Neocarzinostatin family